VRKYNSTILNLVLDEGELSASRPCRFYSVDKAPGGCIDSLDVDIFGSGYVKCRYCL
jgi:hypothetical protein